MFESTQEPMVAEAVQVTSRGGAGLAVTRAGQRSAWLPLPRDGLGAVLDPADVRDRLTTLLSALVGMDLPDPAQADRAAVAEELAACLMLEFRAQLASPSGT